MKESTERVFKKMSTPEFTKTVSKICEIYCFSGLVHFSRVRVRVRVGAGVREEAEASNFHNLGF